jgi:hypothetical protein
LTFVNSTSGFNNLYVDSNSLTYLPQNDTIYATASYTISASYVQSSSYAETAATVDYANVAGYAITAGTASYFSGTVVSASYARSSSVTVSSSYALKATSADNINSGASTKLAYYPSAGTTIIATLPLHFVTFISVLGAVAFLLLLVLNTTHINKKNKKGQNTITKGRAYSTVETQNQKVSH